MRLLHAAKVRIWSFSRQKSAWLQALGHNWNEILPWQIQLKLHRSTGIGLWELVEAIYVSLENLTWKRRL